ncbi:hypothetical protein GCM10023189_54120 [Nibrella saemangeumensis]|uniref:Uncharacterized protein n=1 Tax=Nibrella saemangeumensis TaxID=1084526 RepID=A0ABP8NNL9_9BACT
MKGRKLIIVITILIFAAPELMAQCAMCRGSVESTVSNGRSVVASNLNTGILYLLAVPYLMVAAISYLWYRNSKKEHEQRLAIISRVKRAMS